VIVAHIMGIPVEEGALQLVPVGATVVTGLLLVMRVRLSRIVRRLRRPNATA
jgi:hypothetical protein